MTKVFIDGKAGTTGLQITDYLAARQDIELITLSEENRKNVQCRKEAIFLSDITILCLPDAAAIEAVSLAKGSHAKIIDASTAHRTKEDWAYGFPELGQNFEEKIKSSNKVAAPGCHASGVLALIYPLIQCGLLPKDYPLVCTSLTGYSGGGKKMIAEYESTCRNPLLDSPRLYALNQEHKHLKEITWVAKLNRPPVFCPVVGDFYSGMEVFTPLVAELLNSRVEPSDLYEIYKQYYCNQPLVKVTLSSSLNYQTGDLLAANTCANQNGMTIAVCGNGDRLVPVAMYDNLKKGAAAAAVECLNLMLGQPKEKGLV